MPESKHQLSCVWDLGAELGEGPVWSEAEQALYFVDINGHAIHRFRPSDGDRKTWQVPGRPGFLVPQADGTYLCGMGVGLYRFDPRTGDIALDTLVETDDVGNRINDGFVDAKGRLWFGTMHDGEVNPSGALYCVTRNSEGALHVRRCDEGYVVSNGPAVSPDGKTLYHNNSPLQVIYAFDLAEDGELSNRRVFATLEDGYPDGLAVDSAGTVWVGTWNGGRLSRFAPDGTPLEPIPVPARNVTKLAFGGPDLRTVFVTTARKGLDSDSLQAFPQTGGLFAFTVGTPGQRQAVFTLDRSLVL